MLRKTLLAALIIFAASSAALAAPADVKILNETGKNIARIYLSTIALDEWIEQPELAGEILRDGEAIDIHVDAGKFRPNPIVRYFDIRADYDDGSDEIWGGVDIFSVSEITLRRGGHAVVFED